MPQHDCVGSTWNKENDFIQARRCDTCNKILAQEPIPGPAREREPKDMVRVEQMIRGFKEGYYGHEDDGEID